MNGSGVVIFIEQFVCDNAVCLCRAAICEIEYCAGKVMTDITYKYMDSNRRNEEMVFEV